jgi:hypothetical protein
MTVRTMIWGRVARQAKRDAIQHFQRLPPLVPSARVGLVSTEAAWGVPGCDVLIANEVPTSMLTMADRGSKVAVGVLLKLIPNTQQISRWSAAKATAELTDFLGGGGRPELWSDWQTDEGWARVFVQGPCAGELRREGDVLVVDASPLSHGERKPGVAPLGVKVAIHVDAKGTRPAWIQMEDGTRVTPDQGDAWSYARIVASAAMHNWVANVRHVIFLHYCAGQHVSVLVHNHLPWSHPLHRLLYPHVAGTLAVNWAANASFMGPGRIAEHTYAFTWKGLQQLVPVAFRAFSWEEYDIPEVLARRGVMDLVERGLYPYGEDALLLWGTIDAYVRDYLSLYYADDAAVRADEALQKGLAALDAVMPGKPLRATTLPELARLITRFIHMVSVEHKLVSGIAYDFFTHPYWFPALARVGRNAEEAVPFREEAEQNVMFRHAISAPSWKLMDDWTFAALDERGAGAMRRFQAGLAAAGDVIDQRNGRRAFPFPHLHPTGLESSVGV